jgi:hypothetical protein
MAEAQTPQYRIYGLPVSSREGMSSRERGRVIEDRQDLHTQVRTYFESTGFKPIDGGNGNTRAVYGSPRGTVVVSFGTTDWQLGISIGTADPTLLAEFAARFPTVYIEEITDKPAKK